MPRVSLVPVLVVAALPAATGAAAAGPSLRPTAESTAAPDPGSVGVRLLDIPVATADDPRTRQYIVDRLAPGTVIKRRLAISNTTRAKLSVAVYPAAASIAEGTFRGADGHTANDLSTWIAMSKSAVDVTPGVDVPVTLTLSVPADAAPGEQYAVAWAEVRSPGGSGVALVNRVGIRLYISVGPGNAPASNFSIDTLTAGRSPDGHPSVAARVRNTGGRALDMSGSLTLSGGPGSLRAGPFPAQLGSTLAPGQSTDVLVLLDQQLPDGPWDARLDLKSGLVEQAAEATIRFPADPGTTDAVAASPLGGPPWFLIGVLAALAVLVAVLAVALRRGALRRTARREG